MHSLDQSILLWIHTTISQSWNGFFLWVTNLGGPTAMVALAVIATVYCLYKKHYDWAVIFGAGVIGAGLLNVLLKNVFERVRPDLWKTLVVEPGYSFPSGHAMVSAAFFACLVVVMWPTKWRWPAVVVGVIATGLIGFSRLYLGVHYPTDVVAGWLASIVWVALVSIVVKRWIRRRTV